MLRPSGFGLSAFPFGTVVRVVVRSHTSHALLAAGQAI
jgi:hypothetical protein